MGGCFSKAQLRSLPHSVVPTTHIQWPWFILTTPVLMPTSFDLQRTNSSW